MKEKYLLDGRQAAWIKKYHSKFRYVNIRLTEEEHTKLKMLASKADKSMTDYLRSIIRNAE